MVRQERELDAKYDVIIIGAGIGGLTCGAALAKAGKKVLICEQYTQPGGYVTSFKKSGFTFDGGLQSFSSNGLVFPILKELGLYDKMQFVRADYQLITPDIKVKLSSLAQVKEEFKRAFPKAESEVEAYFQDIERLLIPYEKMFGVDKPALPLLSGSEKATAMFSFPSANLSFIRNIVRYQKTTSLDLINEHITDNRIRLILASIGYPIMAVMATAGMWYSFLRDYWYPIGGMQNFVKLFTDLIEQNGGTISLRTRVDQIMVENGMATGVKLSDGREVRSRIVVSNVDWKQTFTRLIDSQYLEEEFVTQIEKGKVSETFFCVYLGTDLDKSSFEGLTHHTFYLPSYSKPFLEKDINDPNFFRDCSPVMIALPSRSDDSLAPQGRSVVTLTTYAPYDYLGKWKTNNGRRTKAYRNLKQEVADQLIDATEGVIPELSRHIVVRDIATPLTYERYTLNSEGASAGWSWDPTYTFTSKYGSSVGSLKTPITNLFTCGHWCYPPGGVPFAMLTGRMVADMIRGID